MVWAEHRRELLVGLDVANEQAQHLAFHSVLGRGALHRLGDVLWPPPEAPLERHHHRRIGNACKVGKQVPVFATTHGILEALEDRKSIGDGGGLPLDRGKVVATDGSAHHVVDERTSAGGDLPHGLDSVLVDEVGRI